MYITYRFSNATTPILESMGAIDPGEHEWPVPPHKHPEFNRLAEEWRYLGLSCRHGRVAGQCVEDVEVPATAATDKETLHAALLDAASVRMRDDLGRWRAERDAYWLRLRTWADRTLSLPEAVDTPPGSDIARRYGRVSHLDWSDSSEWRMPADLWELVLRALRAREIRIAETD